MLFVINYTIWNLLRHLIIREEGRMFHLSFLLRLHIWIVVISTSLLLLYVVLWSVVNSYPLWRHHFCSIPGHCDLYPGSARQNCVIQRYLSKEEKVNYSKSVLLFGKISTYRASYCRRPWQSDIPPFGQS